VYKEGDLDKVKYYIYKSYRFVWMLAIPIMFGLIAVSNIFIPIFLGEGYEKCIILLDIFSLLVIFIGLSNVTGMQYFVPVGKQNVLTMTVTVGAVINFLLNIVLIKFFSSVGACVASVIAEFFVTAVGFIYVKRKKCFELAPVFKSSIKYWIAGFIMFGCLMAIRIFLPVAIWSLIVLILCGINIYFVALLILKDKLVFEVLNKSILQAQKILKHKGKDKEEKENDEPNDK
jgi:O-antigen/teichoic acid export membrane protein